MQKESGTNSFILEGRKFVVTENTTFEQDMFLLERTTAANLNQLSRIDMSKDAAEQLQGRAMEILLDAYKSGHLWQILAGAMVEEGFEWTEERAVENAEFFRTLRDLKSKKELQKRMVGILLSFFIAGDDSIKISPKSSPSGKSVRQKLEDAEPLPREGDSEARPIMGSGTT